MFGLRGHGGPLQHLWAVGRHGRGRHGHGQEWGRGGRHGRGGDDMRRIGRMLAQGDLRLLALALIDQQPRHGYEIIKLLEEKTGGWYSPSPGVVYPTLTYLEEAGHVTGEAEGSKKRYAITDEGRAHLEENRALVDAVLGRLEMIGERMRRRSDDDEDREDRGAAVTPLVRAALNNLRETAARRLAEDPEAEAKVVEVLARMAAELRKA
jgi:DNA-binding PadR family transcriptional regulator